MITKVIRNININNLIHSPLKESELNYKKAIMFLSETLVGLKTEKKNGFLIFNKTDRTLFIYNRENKNIYFSKNCILLVLEKKFNLDDIEISELIRHYIIKPLHIDTDYMKAQHFVFDYSIKTKLQEFINLNFIC